MIEEKLRYKIGMTGICVVALLSIIGGVLLLPEYILSGGCFALSAVLLYVFYTDITYRKDNEEVFKENTTPRETVIRLSKTLIVFKSMWYSILIALGSYFIYLGKEDFQKGHFAFSIVGFVLAVGYLIKLIRAITSRRRIIINGQGIDYDSKNLIPWREIKNERIIMKKKYTGSRYNSQYDAYYLSFKNKKARIELCLEDYDITDNQVAQLLKIYRSRHSS